MKLQNDGLRLSFRLRIVFFHLLILALTCFKEVVE